MCASVIAGVRSWARSGDPAGGELDGVVEQVQHHLSQLRRIPEELRPAIGDSSAWTGRPLLGDGRDDARACVPAPGPARRGSFRAPGDRLRCATDRADRESGYSAPAAARMAASGSAKLLCASCGLPATVPGVAKDRVERHAQLSWLTWAKNSDFSAEACSARSRARRSASRFRAARAGLLQALVFGRLLRAPAG